MREVTNISSSAIAPAGHWQGFTGGRAALLDALLRRVGWRFLHDRARGRRAAEQPLGPAEQPGNDGCRDERQHDHALFERVGR